MKSYVIFVMVDVINCIVLLLYVYFKSVNCLVIVSNFVRNFLDYFKNVYLNKFQD